MSMRKKVRKSRCFVVGACAMGLLVVGCGNPSDPEWSHVPGGQGQCIMAGNDIRCLLKVLKEEHPDKTPDNVNRQFNRIYQNERIWGVACVKWCPYLTIDRCTYIYNQAAGGVCSNNITSQIGRGLQNPRGGNGNPNLRNIVPPPVGAQRPNPQPVQQLAPRR